MLGSKQLGVIDNHLRDVEADSEAWRDRHRDAMECRVLEQVIRDALHGVEFFLSVDASLTVRSERGSRLDGATATLLDDQASRAAAVCDELAAAAEAFESDGYEVEHLAALRSARGRLREREDELRLVAERLAPSAEQFARLAETHPPPQAWYDEVGD